jgi:hypothetical protein
MFLVDGAQTTIKLENVTAKQKRKPAISQQADARPVNKTKAQPRAARPAEPLDDLYARLNQTKPGSEGSKRIADQIVDAIG